MAERRKSNKPTLKRRTKRKVNLVSSHSNNETEEGALAAYTLEGTAVSDLYKNDSVPAFMRYVPKDGEQVIYEDIYIQDVN